MEASRFDRLVRDVLGSTSRRGLLHLLGALPVVGGLASVVPGIEARKGNGNGKHNDRDRDDDDDVAGEKNKAKRREKRCKKRKKQACEGKCGIITVKCRHGNQRNAKLKKKKVNCGPCACDPPCEGGTCCSDGTCVEVCPGDQVCVDGACVIAECQVCEDGCPFTTVQDAIAAAVAGETITICAGTFVGNIAIDKDLTLVGAGTDDTILQGDGTDSVVSISTTSTVAIQDLTITGGNSSGVGGGITNGTALTTLTRVTVTGNDATLRGGGIDSNVDGQVTLIDSHVTFNTAGTLGGGIYTLGDLSLQDGSTVTDNTAADSGGGIGVGGAGQAAIDATSSVSNNNAVTDGGGVHNEGIITCTAETVTDNTAGDPPATSNCINDGGTGCDSCSP